MWSNGNRVFTIFSKSLKNQELIFHPMAILGSLENSNGLNLANGPQMNTKLILWDMKLFINISKSLIDQWLEYDIIVFLDLPIMINGLDLYFGTQTVGLQSRNDNLWVTRSGHCIKLFFVRWAENIFNGRYVFFQISHDSWRNAMQNLTL